MFLLKEPTQIPYYVPITTLTQSPHSHNAPDQESTCSHKKNRPRTNMFPPTLTQSLTFSQYYQQRIHMFPLQVPTQNQHSHNTTDRESTCFYCNQPESHVPINSNDPTHISLLLPTKNPQVSTITPTKNYMFLLILSTYPHLPLLLLTHNPQVPNHTTN